VVKVIWRRPHRIVISPRHGDRGPRLIQCSLGPHESWPKQDLDPFSRFRVLQCAKFLPSPSRLGGIITPPPYCNVSWVFTTNWISIRSDDFCTEKPRDGQADRRRDRQSQWSASHASMRPTKLSHRGES